MTCKLLFKITRSTLKVFTMRNGSISCFIRKYQLHGSILLQKNIIQGIIIEGKMSSDIEDDGDEIEDRTDVKGSKARQHVHIHLK